MKIHWADILNYLQNNTINSCELAQRNKFQIDGLEVIQDVLIDSNDFIISIKYRAKENLEIYFDNFHINRIDSKKIFLCNEKSNLIIPNFAVYYDIDTVGRLSKEQKGNFILTIENSPSMSLEVNHSKYCCINIINFTNKKILNELSKFQSIEQNLWAVEGSWSKMMAPFGFFDYFINNTIYSDRKTIFGKIISPQDALSLYKIAKVLFIHTDKTYYKNLMKWIAASVYFSQNDDGFWPTGEWCEEPEIHYRLNTDGVRLLILSSSDFSLNNFKPFIEKYIINYIKTADNLSNSKIWFLHDSLELNYKDFTDFNTSAILHNSFGKSDQNAMVLNTHIQALMMIKEFQINFENNSYDDVFNRGIDALKTVLQKPKPSVNQTMLDWLLKVWFNENKRNILFRIIRKLILKNKNYIHLLKNKNQFISRKGYLFRDITFPIYGFWYHIVNLYDLIELSKIHNEGWLKSLISDAYLYDGNAYLIEYLEKQNHYILPQWNQIESALKINYGLSEYTKKNMNGNITVTPEMYSSNGNIDAIS